MSTKFSKRDHEKYIASNLLKSLNSQYEFDRMGNDSGEPDVIFRDTNKTIGVEICLAYYDDSDAKQEWTLARGEREFPTIGYELRRNGVITEPDNLICSKIQAELHDKCSKKYFGVDESWLCIEARAPLMDKESLDKCVSELDIPEGSSFKHIWLCYRAPLNEDGGYKFIEIMPEPSSSNMFSH